MRCGSRIPDIRPRARLCWLRGPGWCQCRSIATACGSIQRSRGRQERAWRWSRRPIRARSGVTLSLERRLSLLAWAAKSGAWILEDDYDSEFRYTGHPLPALKSLDHADRVLFAGSFSKVLFPGLRLGYLVVPEPLTEDIARASRLLQLGQSGTGAARGRVVHGRGPLRPPPAPHALTIRRASRGIGRGSRRGVRRSASTLELQAGGMHLIARFTDGIDDAELARRASAMALRRQRCPASPWSTHAVRAYC